MAEQLRIVVVGGVAAGPKAAARARRLAPEAEITTADRQVQPALFTKAGAAAVAGGVGRWGLTPFRVSCARNGCLSPW